MKKNAAWLLYDLWGWKVEGKFPTTEPKYLVVVAPHTSNWDFPVGLLVRKVQDAKIYYIAKSSLFRWPFGAIFRALGGYPVNRKKSHNFVEAVVELFNSKEEFAISITPEGTRKRVDRFRTGFYYIAKGANIPLVLTRFDWPKKTLTISDPYWIGGDIEKDMEEILAFFRKGVGKNPEYGIFF